MSKNFTKQQKIDFISELYCGAKAISVENGSSWELILAQAALESDWGNKCLGTSNNVFNIKADSSWKGPKEKFYVPETVNHKTVWVWDYFRLYPNVSEALKDRTKFLKENPRYAKNGLYDPGVKGDFKKEIEALKKAGYATDEGYVAEMVKMRDCPMMKTAIKNAQKRGCGPVLPKIEVRLIDGAGVNIADAKISLTRNGKTVETKTNESGHFNIAISGDSGDIELKVFDSDTHQWITLDPIKAPNPPVDMNITLIAPTFTVHTSTREHVKPESKDSKSAPPAPAPKPAPAAKPAPTTHTGAAAHAANPPTHTVSPGDTLLKIAKLYTMSYKSIAEANQISSPYILRIGQVLKIPKIGGETTAPVSTSHSSSGQPGALDRMLSDLIAMGKSALDVVYYRDEKKTPQTEVANKKQAPWMVHAEAEFKKGVKRVTGAGVDSNIIEYLKVTNLAGSAAARRDETPYCAAFVNWVLAKEGIVGAVARPTQGNAAPELSALALKFRDWGRPTKDNKPAFGAVALIRIEPITTPPVYHVTFVAGMKGNLIATLGGNQGHAHEVSHSHCRASWVIAYRYPSSYPHYEEDYVLQDIKSDHATMTAASTH